MISRNRWSHVYLFRVPKGENRKNGKEDLFKEIMAWNFENY